MRCPKCGRRTEVKDSRERKDGAIYRRRWCDFCKKIIYTREIPIDLVEVPTNRR